MSLEDWPRNPEIRAWLDDGHGVDALVGEPPFVILDQHWGVHDTPLVMRQIGYRVADGSDPLEARRWLRSALERLVADGRLADALRFVRDHWATADLVTDLPAPNRDDVVDVLRGAGPVNDSERERATAIARHVADELDVPIDRLLPGAR